MSYPEPVKVAKHTPGFGISRIFLTGKGLRAGWRLLLFAVILLVCQTLFEVALLRFRPDLVAGVLAIEKGAFSAPALFTIEVGNIISVVAALAAMAKIEARPVAAYGLPLEEAFGTRFWEGVLWGATMVLLLYGLLDAEGAFALRSLAVRGWRAVADGLFWALGTLLVAFYEELIFRGYAQFTLAAAIGFWPAATMLSLAFGLIHLFDAFYSWQGVVSAALYGTVFCLALRRTGSLWLGIGFHAAVDFSETFLLSPPTARTTTAGHLLNCDLHGPAWLTGGTVGPEAGVNGFVLFVVVLGLFLLVHSSRRESPAA
ncbi:MAG TPA: CPBP family intramembrane glutamic endopeptidase [Terriglobales bacterium]|nr:CPBP family intramembrane glutamic endopeptidase [Terriglobales bacterium]